ncbi:hypothetical protein GF322_02470 [Candidatus Dependentiae bacterium]|nr:hypothetical protein [Candidatus Dependentiae bacterium]
MNNLFKFFFISIIFSLNCSNYAQNSQTPEDLIGEFFALKDDMKDDENHVDLDLDNQDNDGGFDFDAIDDDFIEKFFQNPAKMAEKLPESLKDRVLDCWQTGQKMYGLLQNPTLFISHIIQNVEANLKFENILNKNCDIIISLNGVLNKIKDYLKEQTLQIILRLNFFDFGEENNLSEIIEELNEILNEFEKLDCNVEEKQKIKNDLNLILKTLKALNDNELSKLEIYKQNYVQKDLKKFVNELILTQEVLDNFIKETKELDDPELKKALNFWNETLKELEPLKPIAGIKSSGLGDLKTRFLSFANCASPLMLSAYSCYRKFIELYKTDDAERLNNSLFWVADQVLRVAMIPIYFLKKIHQIDQIQSNAKLKDLFLKQLLFEAWAIYSDSNFFIKNSNWPLRMAYRLAPAYAYYHSKEYFKNGKFAENLWDADDKNLKRALWFSFKDGYKSLASNLENKINNKINSEILERTKKASFGLVKPELISFIFNTGMPILASSEFLKNNGVANLDRGDIFKKDFSNLEDVFDWNYVGNRDFKNIDNWYYLEGRILGYASIALGNHFGKLFVSKNRKPIRFVLSKTYQGAAKILTKFGFISNETFDYIQDIKSEIKESLVLILKEKDNPILFMMKQFFFPIIINSGLISQLDTANIEESINNNKLDDQQVEIFIEKILVNIIDSVVMAVGGFVGATVSWYGADYAMKEFGPFIPKIKHEYNKFQMAGFSSYFSDFMS